LDVQLAFQLSAGAPSKYALETPLAADAFQPAISAESGKPHTFAPRKSPEVPRERRPASSPYCESLLSTGFVGKTHGGLMCNRDGCRN
jgi:hypothetical protein